MAPHYPVHIKNELINLKKTGIQELFIFLYNEHGALEFDVDEWSFNSQSGDAVMSFFKIMNLA